jgi:hypothetical protein
MLHRALRIPAASAALLATVAVTASAQPGAAEAPAAPTATAAAPHTDSWEDVSHINGQLVPVGEHNEYRRSYRKTNISTNPVGLMIGFYGISVSHGLGQHVAIRGDLNYVNVVNSDYEMTEIGVGVPLYLRRTYQGPFVEPGFIARGSKSCGTCPGESTVGPQVLIGWHRSWDSGFNIAAAFGFGRDLARDDAYHGDYYYEDDEAEIFANGYFRVGYAF